LIYKEKTKGLSIQERTIKVLVPGEPTNLNQIREWYDERDYYECPDCGHEGYIRRFAQPMIKKRDVQEMVIRRIIFLATPNVEEDKLTIKDYKYLFGITDAMIEQYKKEGKL
jgi:hypothetical protein